jgi:hypothetical protein
MLFQCGLVLVILLLLLLDQQEFQFPQTTSLHLLLFMMMLSSVIESELWLLFLRMGLRLVVAQRLRVFLRVISLRIEIGLLVSAVSLME